MSNCIIVIDEPILRYCEIIGRCKELDLWESLEFYKKEYPNAIIKAFKEVQI